MSIAGALLWLSLNIYYEARSEDPSTQIAVAHATINRSIDNNSSIKTEVLKPHQFSWTSVKHRRNGHIPKDKEAFEDCVHSAVVALATPDTTGGATFFHEKSVKPKWAKKLRHTKNFSSFKFYAKKSNVKSLSKVSKKRYNSRRV